MIHYHGGPISDVDTAVAVWRGRHALVSFARPEQIKLAAEIAQSFCLDNGAFSAWKRGLKMGWNEYYAWVEEWRQHPGCDFAIIPDVIDGTEQDNDALLRAWVDRFRDNFGVPVWHMHESLERLYRLCFYGTPRPPWSGGDWGRVAIGSSGCYHQPGSPEWWERMTEIMEFLYAKQDPLYPGNRAPRRLPKLHGLRMLNPKLFSKLPLASADSTHIARSVQIDQKWTGSYQPASKRVRGIVLADRIEAFNAPGVWGAGPLLPATSELSSDLFTGMF